MKGRFHSTREQRSNAALFHPGPGYVTVSDSRSGIRSMEKFGDDEFAARQHLSYLLRSNTKADHYLYLNGELIK